VLLSRSIWANFGCFFEAFFWVSTVAVPSLLYRVDAVGFHPEPLPFESDRSRLFPVLTRMRCVQINGSQLGWLLAADALVFASFVGFAWINSADD
jgi:hypothetical protein